MILSISKTEKIMYATNHVPMIDMSNSPTGCCPVFDPKPWDGQDLKFDDKPFIKAASRSFLFMPLNISSVMSRAQAAIKAAGAEPEEFLVLTQDSSPWRAYHYFAVSKDVPGYENVKLSGEYAVKVFEGEYKNAKSWFTQLQMIARDRGADGKETYFFYTTCPKCAKVYGKNYVIGIVKVG